MEANLRAKKDDDTLIMREKHRTGNMCSPSISINYFIRRYV
jgi:hypothetical protein